MEETAKECGVCQEEFNEDSRCPRIFSCIHTLCTTCIAKLITSNSKQCPFCRKNFQANSANDVMINYTMLELMKSLTTPREKIINDLKKETKETSCLHLVHCQDAQKQIEQTIKEVTNLQENITQENIRIQNDVLPRIHEVISQNNKRIEELDETNKALHIQLKEIKEKNKTLEDITGKLDTCTANTFKETVLLLDEIEETNISVGGWIDHFRELILAEEKTLRTKEKKVKMSREQINIILDVMNSQEEREEEIDPNPGMAGMTEEEFSPDRITLETLQEMSDPVKRLVEEGRIYALQQHEGRRRCARISITNDDKLCLHHLKEEPLPPNVHILQHADVLGLVDRSSRLTFLELSVSESTSGGILSTGTGSTLGRIFGVDGSSIRRMFGVGGSALLGRLYIRLTPDTKGSQHFSHLCTGEMGPSYANTNILGLHNKGDDKFEYVHGGDYEFNDGGGGKAVMTGLEEERWKTEYKKPWLAGTVQGIWGWGWGEARAAQFVIRTGDNPRQMPYACIGKVEDGLTVLTEAISHCPNIKNVIISDCGIVLSS